MGDIAALAANIADVGLLHPVVVTPDMRLVAGERRIRAVERLGRTRIPARVVDLDEIVRGELSENAHRKDFLPSEMVAIWRAVEPMERAAAKARMSEGARVGKISTPSGKTRDRIGAALGVSGRTLEKYVEIVEAAEAEPDRFGHLPDDMDRVCHAETVCRKLKRARDEERVMALERAPGRVRTLVADPPWDYEMAGRATIPYATMSHEEMLALPAAAWVEDDAGSFLRHRPRGLLSALWRGLPAQGAAGFRKPVSRKGDNAMSGAAPPSEAAADVATQVAFDVLAEAAGVAVDCAEALEDAATSGDRTKARLWACMLSRAARSALLTVADLFADPRRAA
jgi:ParB family chromosome partitioning protein